MSDTVIKIESLSKQYRLGVVNHGMLYRDLQGWWARARGKEDPNSMIGTENQEHAKTGDRFWALKDINLEVKQGDTLGIIGRNGAGKSTLLKVLSRVTAPTLGQINVKGRIASLLEVGTGFHPELTGRENIYLNGAILGMNKAETGRKFDEIVDFAGVERFIDTPVKRYSSGMYVRLAFAVAANLEPEILLVDEVLAVGDAEFQKKCLGKMGDVAKEGRTVLFVSHNMAAIRNLCVRAILLKEGQIIVDGTSEEALNHYLSQQTVENSVATAAEIESCMEGVILRNNPHIRFVEIGLYDKNGSSKQSFYSNEPIYIKIIFSCFRAIHDLRIIVQLSDEKDTALLLTQQIDKPDLAAEFKSLDKGVYETSCVLPPNLLGGRTFFVSVQLECIKTEHLVVPKILKFDNKFQGYNNVHTDYPVFFRPQLEWYMRKVN
jgi:lipopolysaccharide transport system ATP-binding protein